MYEVFGASENRIIKMEKNIQNTSLMAYQEILENLGDRQFQVYSALRNLKEADNLTISRYLNLPINCICPRVLELRNLKLVGVAKVDKSLITGRKVIWWRCVK